MKEFMPESLTPKRTDWRWLTALSIASLCGLLVVATAQRPASAQNAAAREKPYTTWKYAGGNADFSNYSALTQINRSNVSKLQVAWTYSSGDQVAYTFQPIVAGRIMYGVAKNGSLVAVDATNGKELWVHSFTDIAARPGGRGGVGISADRGINYWESKDGSDTRVLVRAGGYLEAIDGKTGNLVETFGDKGKVDLHTGMTRNGLDASRSPGQVYDNILILGAATGEAYGSPPADIRGFDIVTGKLVWVFHTIPHPGEPGYETWPKDAWTYAGGAGDWGELSIDEKRGIAYVPTGTPKYEFWGGDRHGDTLYADSILALDARTGKLIWHYQMIHHDIWEYEFIAAPQLLTVRVNGKPIDVVAVAGKGPFMWVFDRVTGKPVWPIEERKVPQSDVAGEQLSPTQPFPTKPEPFERMSYTVKDIDTRILSDAQRKVWTDMVANARNEGLYTPLSDKYFSVMMPGNSGGANLFSTSSDLATGTTYVISYAQPSLERYYKSAAEASQHIGMGIYGPGIVSGDPVDMKQVISKPADTDSGRGRGDPAAQGQAMYQQTCQQCHGQDLSGTPGVAPSLLGVVGRLGPEVVRATIRDGKNAMPEFSAMADSDVSALLTFLQNPTASPAAAPGRGEAGGRGPASPYAYPAGVDVPAPLYTAYGMSPAMVTPPYSQITAYDLNTGTIKWQVPYGEAVGVDPPGNNFGIIKIHGPKARLAITAGGLAFSATIERKMRAFDKDTGKVLWTTALPDGAEGAPAVYEVDGREYVVVCIRGAYVAYALPK